MHLARSTPIKNINIKNPREFDVLADFKIGFLVGAMYMERHRRSPQKFINTFKCAVLPFVYSLAAKDFPLPLLIA